MVLCTEIYCTIVYFIKIHSWFLFLSQLKYTEVISSLNLIPLNKLKKRNHNLQILEALLTALKAEQYFYQPGTMLPQQYYCHNNIVTSCFQQLAIFSRVVLCLKYMHQWFYNYCHASTSLCATLHTLFLYTLTEECSYKL